MENKHIIRFLCIANGLIITILVALVIAGNFIAYQQEKPVKQAWAEFKSRFPKTEANASALKLDKLRKLEMYSLIGTKRTSHPFPLSKVDQKAYEEIMEKMSIYLNAQLDKTNDEVDIPPESVRRYIRLQSANLDAIRTLLLNSELPRWKLEDLDNYLDNTYAQPSYLYWVYLQKILLLDALEKNRIGKPKAALDTLEASWKLNQSLQQRPELIAQLVAIINFRLQTGVLRKADHLPANWRQRLVKPDYQKSFLATFEMESFIATETLKTFPLKSWQGMPERSSWFIFNVLLPFQQPYFTLSAFDYWRKVRKSYRKVIQQDFCLLESWDSLNEQIETSFAWWNFPSRALGSYASQSLKVSKRLIDWELAQKILQVKELAEKSGSWPENVPGIESSSLCKSMHWKYYVSPGGTMSISLINKPKWLVEDDNTRYFLSYSVKLKKPHK